MKRLLLRSPLREAFNEGRMPEEPSKILDDHNTRGEDGFSFRSRPPKNEYESWDHSRNLKDPYIEWSTIEIDKRPQILGIL